MGNTVGNLSLPTRLDFMSVGTFGRAVGGYISMLYPFIHEITFHEAEESGPGILPSTFAYVLASWRPVPALCDKAAKLSKERRLPFIPVILDAGTLQLGPVVVPGNSACWECWKLRSRQHSFSPKERAAVLEFYDTNPEAGPTGFLEPFAMLAAAQIRHAIQLFDDPQGISGYIWQIDLLSRQVSTGRLLGVDGCPNCGLDRPVRDRSYAEARKELSFLWKEPGGAQ